MENYILYGRGEIIQKLRQLGKSKSTMSIHFSGETILSIVVDVLSEKNLLVIDYGVNEELNQKLISSEHAIIKTDYQGINAQFTIKNIRKALLQGTTSFSCPLPEEILWVQRREFYRVTIPMSQTVTCELIHGDNHRTIYQVLDISAGGIAILDKNNELELEPGNLFHNSKLVLSDEDGDTAYINLEIRNQIPVTKGKNAGDVRCGCAFLNVSGDFAAALQKYINLIDIQQNRSD